MKIEVLLKRAHLTCSEPEKNELQKDIDDILNLVVQIPVPKKNLSMHGKCILAEDIYNKRASREDILGQKKMFTFSI